MATDASVITLAISSTTKVASIPGFGVGMLFSNEWPTARNGQIVLTASTIDDVSAFGFSTTGATYAAAQTYFSQSPHPTTLKLARRTNVCTMTVSLGALNTAQGFVQVLTIDGVTYTYTNGASETATTIATALAALIAATHGPNNVAASVASAKLHLSAASGKVYDVAGFYPSWSCENTTSDPGIVADVTAARAVDSTEYGIVLDVSGDATDIALAAYTEANPILYWSDTCSTGVNSSGTSDVASTLKTDSYKRSPEWYGCNSLLHRSAIAAASVCFGAAPGAATMKFKTLTGVAPSPISDVEVAQITGKGCNTYVVIDSIPTTLEGTGPDGTFIDKTRGKDWLAATIKAFVFQGLSNLPKVPFTDPGIKTAVGFLRQALDAGVQANFLAADPPFTTSAPLVKDIDPTVKALRRLPNVTFGATGAGALHGMTINGTITD